MDPLQFCLPVFLGIHRNPKQKDFFNSHLTKFLAWVKGAILAIFQNGMEWLCPVNGALKNPLQEFKKYFCFVCRQLSTCSEGCAEQFSVFIVLWIKNFGKTSVVTDIKVYLW